MSTISPEGPPRIIVDANEILRTSEVHLNVREQYIVTTEDKVMLCLPQRLAVMEQRRQWVAPATTLVALVVAIVTSDFKDLGVSRYTWQAVFMILTLLSGAWLAWAVVRLWQAPSINDVVHENKEGGCCDNLAQAGRITRARWSRRRPVAGSTALQRGCSAPALCG
jgi:hypothetical protein